MTLWFSADWHYLSKNIISHCNRPFNSMEEMDEILVSNFNSKVAKGDMVYLLGDMCWGHNNYENFFKRLNGQKIIILGNHDNEQCYRKLLINHTIAGLYHVKNITIDNNYVWLSHYCHRVWNRSFHESFHLFGHSHSTLKTNNRSMDVGVDNCNFFPISWEEIYEQLKTKSNRENI